MATLEDDLVVHVDRDTVDLCQCLGPAPRFDPCHNIASGYKTFKYKSQHGGTVVSKYLACDTHKDKEG